MMRFILLVVGVMTTFGSFANTWTLHNLTGSTVQLRCAGAIPAPLPVSGVVMTLPGVTNTYTDGDFTASARTMKETLHTNHCFASLAIGVMSGNQFVVNALLTNNNGTTATMNESGVGTLAGMKGISGVYNGHEYILSIKQTGANYTLLVVDVPVQAITKGVN